MSDEKPRPTSTRAAAAFMCAAVIATTIAAFAIADIGSLFDYSEDLNERTSNVPGRIALPPDLQAEVDAADARIRLQTTAFTFALMGAVFAACFGIAAGVVQRSLRVGRGAVVCGVPSAAILGAMGGCVGQWFDDTWQVHNELNAFLLPVLMHSAAWVFVVVGCTAVVTWSSRGTTAQIGSNSLWSALGLVLALVLFQVLSPLLFIDRTNIPVPEGFGNRFLWIALVAGQLALAYASGMSQLRPPAAGT